jgi:hypothetical protein
MNKNQKSVNNDTESSFKGAAYCWKKFTIYGERERERDLKSATKMSILLYDFDKILIHALDFNQTVRLAY